MNHSRETPDGAPERPEPAVRPWPVAREWAVATILLALVLLLPSVAHSGNIENPVRLGLEFGLNRAVYTTGPASWIHSPPLMRLRAGATISFVRNRSSSLESGLLLNMQGGHWHSHFAPGGAYEGVSGFDRTLRTFYLVAPFLVRVCLSGPPVRPFVNAGFEPGYLLAARDETWSVGLGQQVGSDRDARSLLSSFHLDGVLGAGVLFPLRGRSYLIGLSYLHGLNQVDDNTFRTEGDLPVLNSRCIRMTLGTVIG